MVRAPHEGSARHEPGFDISDSHTCSSSAGRGGSGVGVTSGCAHQLSFGSLVTTLQAPSSSKEGPGSGRRPPGARTATVLVADADDDIRQTLVETLREETSWSVIEAKDGPEALRLVIAEEPDAMIIDQRLPEMTGA